MKDIRVLEESRSWLVVEKPAGLPTHATNLDEPDLLTMLGGKLHAVHRLDRDTSGLLLIAKNKETAAALMGLWGTDAVGKFYRAVVHGAPGWERATWSRPLSDRAEGRDDPAGPKSARKDCLTEALRLEIAEAAGTAGARSLLELRLRTGRKHQIRRHALLEGFPLVGDRRYGKNDRAKRLALHACKLQVNWKGLAFEWISEPPEDFRILLEP